MATKSTDGQKGKFPEYAKRLAGIYGVKKVWGSTDGRFWATSEVARDKTLKGKEIDEYSFPPQTPAQEA
ncbi:MAG: hypothetical protein LBK22_06750 [Tannerella sp.]|jgi:hypothetical protein|nr:hypothetical protein [Tannerella sp.]